MSIQMKPAAWIGQAVFPTIQAAQQSELLALMCGDKVPHDHETKAAEWMVTHVDEIVAILTCTPKSKAPRKPRSDIGKKRSKKDATAAAL